MFWSNALDHFTESPESPDAWIVTDHVAELMAELGPSFTLKVLKNTSFKVPDQWKGGFANARKMAARMQQGGRPGGARFAQFKLVLLGAEV